MRPGKGAPIVAAGLAALAGFLGQAHMAAVLRLLGLPPGNPLLAVIADLAGILGWLGLAGVATGIADAALRRYATLHHGGRPPRLVHDLVRVLFFGAAVATIVAVVFEQPISGMIATSGVAVAVIGFALRNMIADVFSGIALNLERPYRTGDWVEVAPNVIGRVEEINWRATRLITRDHTSLVVPNGLIAGSRFVNFSYPEPHYRANIHLSLDAAVPVEQAKRVLLAAVLGCPKVLAEPRPQAQLEGVDERGVAYVIRYWVAEFSADAACRDAVLAAIMRELGQAGLAPAYPKREVALGRRSGRPAPVGLAEQLARLPLFGDFAADEIAHLATAAQPRHFAEGQAVVQAGAPGGSLFLLSEGALDVWGEDGTVMLDRMLPGQVFGEISLLTGQPRTASVIAATDAVAFEIRKEDLEPILQGRPELAEELAKLMVRRQQANRERLLSAAARRDLPRDPAADDLLHRLRVFFGLS